MHTLRNPEIAQYFRTLSAHSDLADEFVAHLKHLGEYRIHGGGAAYSALYCVTDNVVFAGAAGMRETYWRLRSDDVGIALATGAEPSDLGPDWVRIALFRSNWPKPDLSHWALRAYDFARTGR